LKAQTKSLTEIHIAVFLFGFSALFGKVINQLAITIVFARVSFAAITLGITLILLRSNFKLKSKKDFIALTILGFIFAIHWVTFFQAIKVSSIAIAVITFSTFPIFVTFMEPYIFKEKIKKSDLVIALITFMGILFVVPEFDLANNYTQGALWGIAAGFTCAILTVYSKKYIKKYSGILISFYQCITATVILCPFVFYLKLSVSPNDLALLILLGVIFTALSHTLFIRGTEHVKAQLASIIVCLEPVYGITFAAILLKEIPTFRTIIGGVIILSCVLYASLNLKTESLRNISSHSQY